MNIIFQIDGGLGKCIMATALCEVIHKNNPDAQLIVVSGYPDVFLNNPFVYRSFAFGQQQYFYQEFIENKEVKIYAHNPYVEVAHVQRTEHLLVTWSKLLGYEYNGEKTQLFLTNREIEFYSNKFVADKPILTIQTNGGAPNQELKYSWARDIPRSVTQKVIDHFAKTHIICHIRREDQPAFEKTIPVSDNFRSMCVLLMMSQKRLLMDSFAQHASACLGLSSVVCWVGNSPHVFGYELHKNIVSQPWTKKPELRNAYLGLFNIAGDPLEIPYNNETEIFDAQAIIEALEAE